MKYLPLGEKLVSWVFKDDGPIWNGRQPHPDIPIPPLVVPANVDLRAWKLQLWRGLEDAKNASRFLGSYGLPLILLSADGEEIGMITSENMRDWTLVEHAHFFRWAGKRYTRSQFRELIQRALMPSNVMQIG